MPDSTDNRRPWYREPIMALVIGIPAITVVAGLTTVYIAHTHVDTVVADEYRKEGLAIQHDPARDLAAARVGAHASIDLTNERLSMQIGVAAGAQPESVVLIFSHATRAELDRMVTASRGPDGRFTATLEPLAAGHWYVELSPSDRAWRLRSDFTALPVHLDLEPGRAP